METIFSSRQRFTVIYIFSSSFSGRALFSKIYEMKLKLRWKPQRTFRKWRSYWSDRKSVRNFYLDFFSQLSNGISSKFHHQFRSIGLTTSNLKFYSLYNRPSHWQLFVNFTRADGAAVELYEIYKSIVCPYLSNGEIDHWCNITQITEEFRYIYHHFTVDWRVGWWRLVKWTSFYFPFLHSTEILR